MILQKARVLLKIIYKKVKVTEIWSKNNFIGHLICILSLNRAPLPGEIFFQKLTSNCLRVITNRKFVNEIC